MRLATVFFFSVHSALFLWFIALHCLALPTVEFISFETIDCLDDIQLVDVLHFAILKAPDPKEEV